MYLCRRIHICTFEIISMDMILKLLSLLFVIRTESTMVTTVKLNLTILNVLFIQTICCKIKFYQFVTTTLTIKKHWVVWRLICKSTKQGSNVVIKPPFTQCVFLISEPHWDSAEHTQSITRTPTHPQTHTADHAVRQHPPSSPNKQKHWNTCGGKPWWYILRNCLVLHTA